jgi:hypothetical protein
VSTAKVWETNRRQSRLLRQHGRCSRSTRDCCKATLAAKPSFPSSLSTESELIFASANPALVAGLETDSVKKLTNIVADLW